MSSLTTTQVQVAPQPQTNCHRIVLSNRAGISLPLQRQNGKDILPQVGIPQFTHPSEEVIAPVRSPWRAQTILLFSSVMTSGQETAQSSCRRKCARVDEADECGVEAIQKRGVVCLN